MNLALNVMLWAFTSLVVTGTVLTLGILIGAMVDIIRDWGKK